jgi:hypothetical protein
MILRASSRLAKRCSLRHSSRYRPLKLSMKPVWAFSLLAPEISMATLFGRQL